LQEPVSTTAAVLAPSAYRPPSTLLRHRAELRRAPEADILLAVPEEPLIKPLHRQWPRMTPQELVSDALDAVVAGANDEIVAGAQSRQVYQQFIAGPKALEAMMLTRLPQRS